MTQALDAKDTCVIVTGGGGFIGSHTVVQLLKLGYQVVIVDDLSNSSAKVEDRIKAIVGDEAAANLTMYVADVNDVTGGGGFIGSHTVVQLLKLGYQVVIVDDLSNSSAKVEDRIKAIVGDEAAANLTMYVADVNDREALGRIFDAHRIDCVIHFAGYKAVGESVAKPIEYYGNNIGNTITLVDVMREHGCKSIIFSSSATVYGDPDSLPLTEESPKKPATNPYGWTKWMIEQMLTDLHTADAEWNVVLLRPVQLLRKSRGPHQDHRRR